jgi:hypothetical protein
MKHTNVSTRKERDLHVQTAPIRPQLPLLPSGHILIRTVGESQPGTVIIVPDLNNQGEDVNVFVPPVAKVGDKMAVPIPAKGESVKDLQLKQQRHHEKIHGSREVQQGAALVRDDDACVGGVILGSHLQDNTTREAENWIGSISAWLGDADEDVENFIYEAY